MPTITSARILTLAVAATVLGPACSGAKDAKSAPDTTAVAASPNGTLVPAVDGSYELQLPARWSGLYRVDSLSSSERGTARPGAFNVVYLPQDTTILPQTIVVIAVYDSIAWAKQKAEGGPPPGDSIMSHAGRVYILGLPQSNPFTAGSVDALKFDSLALNPVEKSSLIHTRN